MADLRNGGPLPKLRPISHILTPCKIRGWVGELLGKNEASPTTEPLVFRERSSDNKNKKNEKKVRQQSLTLAF